MLLEGHSHKEIASKIGVSREWVSKLAKSGEVQDVLQHGVAAHEGRLRDLVGLALDALEDVLASDDATYTARIRAAEAVLDRAGFSKVRARDEHAAETNEFRNLSNDELSAMLAKAAADLAALPH